jgi:hypothetical protein
MAALERHRNSRRRESRPISVDQSVESYQIRIGDARFRTMEIVWEENGKQRKEGERDWEGAPKRG